MCKLYQIEYTCRHHAKVETAYCRPNQSCTPPSSKSHSPLAILSSLSKQDQANPTTTSATYSNSCARGIEILIQHAPHKCPPCRNYDRDRWRRGWPRIPLPQPARSCVLGTRTVPAEPDSDDGDEEDDFAVEFEEGTFLGHLVEHEEEKGGVGLGFGFGA
ncbi:hypothetical protein IFR05_013353, partial [Cadophora sp. M221]